MDWKRVQKLAGANAELRTITGQPFRIISVSERIVTIEVSTGKKHTITHGNLNRAEQLLLQSQLMAGPGEYRIKVTDQRPAYAWVILHKLGYV